MKTQTIDLATALRPDEEGVISVVWRATEHGPRLAMFDAAAVADALNVSVDRPMRYVRLVERELVGLPADPLAELFHVMRSRHREAPDQQGRPRRVRKVRASAIGRILRPRRPYGAGLIFAAAILAGLRV